MSETTQWVIDVDPGRFEEEVLQNSHKQPVVVDFWAPWCGPCRMLGPMLEKAAKEGAGKFVLAKVNIDEAPDLAAAYGIEAIPAIKAFRDGQVVLGFVGVLAEGQLQDFLAKIGPSEADQLVHEAREVGKPAEAEKLYRQALEKDPNQQAALVALARILIDRGQEEEARGLLERVAPGDTHSAEAELLNASLALRTLVSEYGSETEARNRLKKDPTNAKARFELGCVLAGVGKYPDALAELLAAAEANKELANKQIRDVMVKIFHIIGVRSPMADEYRDKLTRVLY